MKNKIFILIAFLAFMQFASAQSADHKFSIGLSGVLNEYNGDYGNGVFNFNRVFIASGISLFTYLNPSFDFGLQGSYGEYGYFKDVDNLFRGNKLDMYMLGKYKINNGYIIEENSKLSPFFALGVGYATYSRLPSNDEVNPLIIVGGADLIVPMGAGLKYQITDFFAVQYQYLYFLTNHDNREEIRGPNVPIYDAKPGNDAFGEHIVSLVFSIGKAKDTDRDGIADKYDLCPKTPLKVEVDKNGCPVDSDNDGVADYLDKCPNTPANVKVDQNGCPIDTDKDGVADYLDKCPNTPLSIKVDKNGCPIDSDNDGVADYLDKCSNTPANVKVDEHGCPLDTDNDGVADYLDKCPNTPADVQVDQNGCPLDSDNDGVPDYLDKCPDVPGIIANKGCPEIKEEVKKILSQALLGIHFETNKDIIKSTSFAILNQVVDVMKENTSYLLDINGHTDSQGADDANLILSQNRADAVK
ncbi:MAG: OmpA family protein [Paludibacter sp.]|nr:OmpA family protein [Paludibacter sp.]